MTVVLGDIFLSSLNALLSHCSQYFYYMAHFAVATGFVVWHIFYQTNISCIRTGFKSLNLIFCGDSSFTLGIFSTFLQSGS